MERGTHWKGFTTGLLPLKQHGNRVEAVQATEVFARLPRVGKRISHNQNSGRLRSIWDGPKHKRLQPPFYFFTMVLGIRLF